MLAMWVFHIRRPSCATHPGFLQGAQAIRRSLEYKATGHHQFLIANSVSRGTMFSFVASRSRSYPTEHYHSHAQRRARRKVFPRCAIHPHEGPERHPTQHRQGQARAGIRAQVRLEVSENGARVSAEVKCRSWVDLCMIVSPALYFHDVDPVCMNEDSADRQFAYRDKEDEMYLLMYLLGGFDMKYK